MTTAISIPSAAQILVSDTATTNVDVPYVGYGLSRLAFTTVFHGDATFRVPVLGGFLSVQQRYRGASLLLGVQSFRDDQLFRADWRYRLSDYFEVFPRLEWDVSNDTRSLGIARLTRLRTATGISLLSRAGMFAAFAGLEQAEQLGIAESGLVVGGNYSSRLDNLGDIALTYSVAGEFVQLSVRRNADLDIQFYIASPTDRLVPFQLSLAHRRQLRDYYTTVGLMSTRALEHRSEEKWSIQGQLQQQLFQGINISLHTDIALTAVERFFSAPLEGSALTYVLRRLDEYDANAVASLSIIGERSNHELSLSLRGRRETNVTSDRFDAPVPQLVEELRQSERMRDNVSNTLRLSTSNRFSISRNDSLQFDALVGIVRYDTPSLLNYDDRDELSQLLQLVHRRQWSDAFSSRTIVEYAATHFVFLRAQRSALSNWNRSVRLATRCMYAGRDIQWYPSFEILAQYTSYDFEGFASTPTSFSFRQLAYRDSISVHTVLGMFQAQVYVRWFVRSDFSWSSFAEYPRGFGSEQFLRCMLWRQLDQHVEVGLGGRWYALGQQLSVTALTPLSSQQQSIAPDVGMRVNIQNLSLQISGWYELRRVGQEAVQPIPNIQLNVVRRL
ncbi:MAG: hypothetical protein N2663_03470 [Chlorobi bacterium]|nr:hypothetical protein [Chlorobiota bacterium]